MFGDSWIKIDKVAAKKPVLKFQNKSANFDHFGIYCCMPAMYIRGLNMT